MKEHPILFDGDAVRAILAGRKTQTRRPIKPPMNGRVDFAGWHQEDESIALFVRQDTVGKTHWSDRCPCGVSGDHLWVRETWCDVLSKAHYTGNPDDHGGANDPCAGYRATMTYMCGKPIPDIPRRWRPSIHMPRWASRITLEVTDVRVERVQDITDDDAWEEGAWWWRHDDAAGPPFYVRKGYNVECFSELWDTIYAKRGLGWDANPWVWAIEFRREVPAGERGATAW